MLSKIFFVSKSDRILFSGSSGEAKPRVAAPAWRTCGGVRCAAAAAGRVRGHGGGPGQPGQPRQAEAVCEHHPASSDTTAATTISTSATTAISTATIRTGTQRA